MCQHIYTDMVSEQIKINLSKKHIRKQESKEVILCLTMYKSSAPLWVLDKRFSFRPICSELNFEGEKNKLFFLQCSFISLT